MPLAILDFLNSREDAAVLWLAVLLVIALIALGGQLLPSLAGLLSALVPKLLLVYGGGAVFCAGVVYLAARAGLWHRGTLKETVYWFAATGIAMTAYAIEKSPNGVGYLRRFLRRAVLLTIVAEFVVNLYVFPLFFEILLFPVFVLLAYSQLADNLTAAQRKVADRATTWLGIFLLSYVALMALTDLEGLLTRDTLEGLLVAPVLTVAFIPYLFWLGWIVRRERESLHKRFRAQRARAQQGGRSPTSARRPRARSA